MEASKSLWVISDELEAIGERIAENAGELTPELEAELDTIEVDFTQKIERIALFVRESDLNADKAKAEADRLTAIRKHHEAKVRGLKSYLLAVLERHGRDKVDTHKARVRRVANSQPSIRWTGDTFDQIPDMFRHERTVITLDTDAVKDALREGEPLDERIVVERGSHIRIS